MDRKQYRKIIPIILAVAVIVRPQPFAAAAKVIWSAMVPILWGMVLAAMICPAVERFAGWIRKLFRRIKPRTADRLAIAAVYILLAAVFAGVVSVVLPKLIDSARLFLGSADGYYRDLRRKLGSWSAPWFDAAMESISSRLPQMVSDTLGSAADMFRGAAGFTVGLVLSVYILAAREELIQFIGSAAEAVLSPTACRRWRSALSTVYSCLTGFVSGQLSEALVLGTLCFAGMVIFDFDYPLLISTIIGVTALVPVVGAIVGTIPSALILFLVKPSSAMWFIVYIIILQQLENNLIYPKVVGRSVGSPPLLIMTAIIIGAELGGAVGILAAIPLASSAYELARRAIEKRRQYRE